MDSLELASSLEQLLSESDIITLQLVLSPSTRHILGAKELAHMKPTSILVNTSRGGLIDTQALVDILTQRKIRVSQVYIPYRQPELGHFL